MQRQRNVMAGLVALIIIFFVVVCCLLLCALAVVIRLSGLGAILYENFCFLTASLLALETVAGTGSKNAGSVTFFFCTALDHCPGP